MYHINSLQISDKDCTIFTESINGYGLSNLPTDSLIPDNSRIQKPDINIGLFGLT